jgi:peptide/nickel transport system substrate-binding protein
MLATNLRVRAISLVATAALAVTACGPAATPSPSAPSVTPNPGTSAPASTGAPASASAPASTGPQAQPGGTVHVLLTTATSNGDQFTDMDPQRIYIGEDIAFFGATINRTLTNFKYSADLKEGTSLVPDAATDTGTPNADATAWTFTLKDGMKWQDGSAVKCQDFAYGASRTFATDLITNGPTYILGYLKVPTKADGSSEYPGPYKATPDQQALFDKAVVCDGNKITYNLAKPIPDFNFTVTLGLGAVPNPTDHPGVDTAELYTLKPWSDGPYMIDSYTPGKGGNLTLVRNPNWTPDGYRGAYPDKWVVDLGLDPEVVDGRLMSPTGDDVYALQYGNVQPQNLSTVFSDGHTAAAAYAGRAISDLDPYVRYWWINQDTVKNEKIRQAMAVAIDRDSIRAAAGGDFYGDLADGLIKPNLPVDYAPTGWATDLFGQAIPPGGNVELAKQLIKDSGEAAPTLTFDYGKSPVGDKVAAIVQSSLQRVGFTIKLNPIESGYYAAIGDPTLQHDFGASGWGPDWPNASTVIPPLLAGAIATTNASDYPRVTKTNYPDFTAAIDDAITTLDRAQQASKWQALNKEAVQKAFIIPNVFSLSQVIAGTKVSAVGGLYKWPPAGSWPYGQIYVMQ